MSIATVRFFLRSLLVVTVLPAIGCSLFAQEFKTRAPATHESALAVEPLPIAALRELDQPSDFSTIGMIASEPGYETTKPTSPSVPAAFSNPVSTVLVTATATPLEATLTEPYQAGRAEVLSSAGTFGDFTRYLQVLPGVVSNSDQSNDIMVRGGHPSENLYVVDGVEIQNINHIALEGTSGGFTSMIDTSSIESVDMKSGIYDAKYSSRLSSLISIHTREGGPTIRAGEFNAGIAGVGGFVQRPLGRKGSTFFSGHRSLLNVVASNIGLNGTPIYTNGMGRTEWSPSDKDNFSILNVSGADSIDINPCAGDVDETLYINTQYFGWRSTGAMTWQHLHSGSSFSTFTASYSGQSQNIGQQMQETGGQYHNTVAGNTCTALVSTDIYKEKTSDGIAKLNYDRQFATHGWLLSVGSGGTLTRLNYDVAQPMGEPSALNPSGTWTDSDSFTRKFSTGQTGSFAEATGPFGKRWTAMLGVREETFALLHAHLFEPRASLAYRLNSHQALSLEYGKSSQLPPAIDLVSYSENSRLQLLLVEQATVGADLWRANWATLSVHAYNKRYFDEPVSTEYPSLMLANMVDTLGQAFLWLPLQSGGHGNAQGLEMMLRAAWPRRMQFLGSAAYARTRYAALDNVLRPGNFDVPLIVNGMTSIWLPGKVQLSVRDTYSSGRPYTPYDVPLSKTQFRGIYDLTRVNALRGPAYNRLNVEANRNFNVSKGILNINVGVENVFDRKNFVGYAWLDRCPAGNNCGSVGAPMQALYQMPIFPIASLRYSF